MTIAPPALEKGVLLIAFTDVGWIGIVDMTEYSEVDPCQDPGCNCGGNPFTGYGRITSADAEAEYRWDTLDEAVKALLAEVAA